MLAHCEGKAAFVASGPAPCSHLALLSLVMNCLEAHGFGDGRGSDRVWEGEMWSTTRLRTHLSSNRLETLGAFRPLYWTVELRRTRVSSAKSPRRPLGRLAPCVAE